MALKPGWYPQDDGTSRYWDGTQWNDPPPTAAPSTAVPPTAPVKKSNAGNGCVLGAGVFVVLAVIFGFSSCGGDDDSGPNEFNTQATCKDIVRKQLKNPSTADFSGEQQSASGASGTVVAENALGGKVTYSYRCTLTGNTVELVDFTAR